MKIYALKDLKVGYMTPMLHANDDVAIRAYKNTISDPNPNLINQNPQDFELFCLGDYDQESGIIKSEVRFVFNAAALTNK